MSKKGIAKVVAGAVFIGGITFAGVNYNGADSINNITNKADDLADRFEQATADVTYLQGEFDALNGLYADDMVEANGIITKLRDTAIGFKEEIKALQAEIESGNTDNTVAQDEIQAEITRLEAELTQANTEIADLEAHILQIESETQYEPINKEAYEAKDLEMAYTADFIRLEAYELDYDLANIYADNATDVMDAFTKEKSTINIIGVDVAYSKRVGVIAFVLDDASFDGLNSITNGTLSHRRLLLNTANVLNTFGTDKTYFVNESKSSLIEISQNGDISAIVKQ